MLVPELQSTHNGYFELYRNDAPAVLQHEADKATEKLVPKLRRFGSVLVADVVAARRSPVRVQTPAHTRGLPVARAGP